MIHSSSFDISEAAREALLRAQELTRLQDDLLEYLQRRKAGGWSLARDIKRDGLEITHKGEVFGFVSSDDLRRDGAEATSARVIAEVKSWERVAERRRRKSA